MKRYVLLIDGDFEKGECAKCPLLAVNNYYPDVVYCPINFGEVPCPLEEVKQGEWINKTNVVIYDDVYMADCTNCGEEIAIIGHDSFCPNCGADMRTRHDD